MTVFIACSTAFLVLASMGAAAADTSVSMGQISNLFWIVAILGLAIGLFVGIVLVITVLKWRVRKGHTAPKPGLGTSNHKLEASWTIVPAVILLVIGVLAFETLAVTDTIPQHPDAVLTVVARQWAWEFYLNYTANGTSFHTNGSFAVKANLTILVKMISLDVDHSFFIDQLGFHLDAIPGSPRQLGLTPTMPGAYVIRCTQYCGSGHATMTGWAYVLA